MENGINEDDNEIRTNEEEDSEGKLNGILLLVNAVMFWLGIAPVDDSFLQHLEEQPALDDPNDWDINMVLHGLQVAFPGMMILQQDMAKRVEFISKLITSVLEFHSQHCPRLELLRRALMR